MTYRIPHPHNPAVYDRVTRDLAARLVSLRQKQGGGHTPEPETGAGDATPSDRDTAALARLEARRLELIRKQRERRAKKAAIEAKKAAAKAARDEAMESRLLHGGGIDPDTGRPYRGSCVATASVFTRNAIQLSNRFFKLGDTQTADELSRIAELGQTLIEVLTHHKLEHERKVREAMEGAARKPSENGKAAQ